MKSLPLIGLVLFAACAAQSRPPIVFDSDTLARHRIEGEATLPAPEGTEAGFDGIEVMVTVTAKGEVIDARVESDHNRGRSDPTAALAEARRWKFRPFLYRGTPVPARGIVSIAYRPRPRWRDPDAVFPGIDYSDLKIGLTRSACYGSCPDYAVTIDGAGRVEFTTEAPSIEGPAEAHRSFGRPQGVLLPGVHRARIDRPAVDSLIERFRAARFFGLEREYVAMVTDLPTYKLTFETGGRAWSVTDYWGERIGMPPVVTELEDAVDQAAGTARWTRGNEATVASLRDEGFDFRTQKAAELTAYAAMVGGEGDRMILDLIEAGVSLEYPLVFDTGDPPTPLGETLLLAAVARQRSQLFFYLAERGWLARIPRQLLSETFARGGGGCDPRIARALVAAGADPMARAPSPAVGQGGGGSTALIAALVPYGPCYKADLKPLIEELVALGVDVNSADDEGETALFGVENPDLQELLIATGARADVRDEKGRSPAFSSWNDRIVLGLLDAGADPKGRYDDGKTLREQAVARDMPSVLAWLDAHGVK
jgi:hypothetical protein